MVESIRVIVNVLSVSSKRANRSIVRRSHSRDVHLDIMLADCELTSNCSSMSNESARMYCGRRFSEHPYDNPRLENVRVSMTAERKKPVLITRTKTLVNGRSQVEKTNAISRDEAFVKSRYEARRKFFEDLERRKSATDSFVLSRSKATSANDEKDKSMLEQNSTDSNEKLLVKLFDASVTNASMKEHVENLSGEARSNENVAMHSVVRTNITQPSFVERVNVEEARLSSRDIVFCINGDSRTEAEIGHRKRVECPTVETIASMETESPTTHGDKSNSMVGMDNEQQQHALTNTEMTLARSCAKTIQRDNSDNEEDSHSLSDLSSNNYDGRSIDRYECGEDKEVLTDKEINGDLKSTVNLKKRNVRSWIESSMCDSNWSSIAEADSYESYCNDITKIIESIDVNIASSRTELDVLPDTDTCVKYNLDSTNMSLIYSLTPPAAVDQNESGNDDTLQDLAERSSDWQSDSTRSDNDEPLSDYIWIEPETTKTEYAKSTQDRRSSSGSSYAELDRQSTSGSDILELPSCTIRELKDIDGEVFLNGINESANEIIADLNASDEMPPSYDAVEIAQQIIAEIIESIYILLHLDSSIHDLSIVREIVRNLINSYQREYLLMESGDQACMSDVFAMIGNNVDNICRVKGFLGNLSGNFDNYDNRDYEMGLHQTEGRESPAVIEFCTVAKKLPIVAVDNSALELNFRVIKVSTNEYADMSPGAHLRLFGENSIVVDRGLEIGKARGGESAAMIKSDAETWPCERCSYCREEELIREKLNLTPISEEPDDVSHEAVDSLKDLDDELLCHLEINDVIEENMAANSMRKHVSLDDTYTISEVSSVVISDNDEMNDFEERCVWGDVEDFSIDCMSYSYETKEFMNLEKALAAETARNCPT